MYSSDEQDKQENSEITKTCPAQFVSPPPAPAADSHAEAGADGATAQIKTPGLSRSLNGNETRARQELLDDVRRLLVQELPDEVLLEYLRDKSNNPRACLGLEHLNRASTWNSLRARCAEFGEHTARDANCYLKRDARFAYVNALLDALEAEIRGDETNHSWSIIDLSCLVLSQRRGLGGDATRELIDDKLQRAMSQAKNLAAREVASAIGDSTAAGLSEPEGVDSPRHKVLEHFDREAGELMLNAWETCGRPLKSLPDRQPHPELVRIAEQLDEQGFKLLNQLSPRPRESLATYNKEHPGDAVTRWVTAIKCLGRKNWIQRIALKRLYRAATRYRKADTIARPMPARP